MKAGAFTPATLHQAGGGHPQALRSMKAGLSPPQPTAPSGASRAPGPLNEGGGFHPRNPATVPPLPPVRHRSMKAGAFTPATRDFAEPLPPRADFAQ